MQTIAALFDAFDDAERAVHALEAIGVPSCAIRLQGPSALEAGPGLLADLTEAGVSEGDAQLYAEGVRRGGALVTARVDDAIAPRARPLLECEWAVNLNARRCAYRQEGWIGFVSTASHPAPAPRTYQTLTRSLGAR